MNYVLCPYCRYQLLDDGTLSGQAVMCPSCQGQFSMPSSVAIRPTENVRSTVYIQQSPKNSGIAAVLSFFYIGLGQIYNGQIGKGLLMMIIPVPLAVVIIFSYFIAGAATLANEEEISRPSIKVNGVDYHLDELPANEWDRLPPDMRVTVESELKSYEKRIERSHSKTAERGLMFASGFFILMVMLALFFFGAWVFGIYDAYSTAERINRKHSSMYR